MSSYRDEDYSSRTTRRSTPSKSFFKPTPIPKKRKTTPTKSSATKRAAQVKAPVTTVISRPKGRINLAIAFDTTSSMGIFRDNMKKKSTYLYEEIIELLPELVDDMEISFVGIGDHCDEPYMIQSTAFSGLVNTLKDHIESIRNTAGGDIPEAYECLFKKLNTWDIEDANVVLILVGDSIPHGMNALEDDGCDDRVDYEKELKKLKKKLKAFYFISCTENAQMKRLQKRLVDDEEHFIELGGNFRRLTNVVHGIVAQELKKIDKYLDHIQKTRGAGRATEIKTLLKTKTK